MEGSSGDIQDIRQEIAKINEIIGDGVDDETLTDAINEINDKLGSGFTSGHTVADALEELEEELTEALKITLETGETTSGYLKTYELKQGGTLVGKIDIPKDMVVSGGSLVHGTWSGDTFTEESGGTDTAIKIEFANADTIYINTWHGAGTKKIGNACAGRHDYDLSNVNMMLVQSDFEKEIFIRDFKCIGKNIIKTGFPRNDELFHLTDEDRQKYRKQFNIPDGKKVILYAPTWRENKFYNKSAFKFDTEMDFDEMHNQLSDDYILIVKFHYLVKENIDWSKYGDFIIECDADWDIQELYLISDIMITDYSSVMFDYAILKRPMIFFTFDLDDYKNNLRDFYFDMVEEVPGPIFKTNDEMISYIKNFNRSDYDKEYCEKYKRFNEKFNQFDDGNASKKVIELIKNQ